MNNIEIKEYLEKLAKKENVLFEYSRVVAEKANINGFGIEKTINFDEESIFISAIVSNKKGHYYVRNINKKKIDEGLKKAKKIAKLKTEKEIDCFGNIQPRKKISFDKQIKDVCFSDVLKTLKKEIVKEKHVLSYVGEISKISAISNLITKDVQEQQEMFAINNHVLVNTKKQTQNSGDFYSVFTRKKDINIKETIDQAKINAQNLLSPKQGEKGEYRLIFTPEVVYQIVYNFILNATKGDVIYKKRSYLYNLLNKQIFSKNLTIVEEPHIDCFLGSSVVDEEAVKTKQKTIVDKGVVKKVVYDKKHGLLAKKKSTGNHINKEISYTNILLKPGRKKIVDIIDSTKKGVLIYSVMGLHTNNIVTGDFSLTIANAKEIVNGKYKRTFTNLNLTGNIKELLKDIYFSKEQRFFGDRLVSFGVVDKHKLL